MTRAKTKMKSTKKPAKTQVDFVVHIHAPHAYVVVSVECDKALSKNTPKLMRQLADAIETGDVSRWLESQTGVTAFSTTT